jgi:DHA2 family multidrug resistance protein
MILALSPTMNTTQVPLWIFPVLCVVLLAHFVSVLVFFIENDLWVKSDMMGDKKYHFIGERLIGASLFLFSQVLLSRMTLASGVEETFWPLILRGFGLGLIFVPLTAAAMAETSPRNLAQATGLFNLMRQLGGSLGITIMATLLGRFTQVNKAVLTEHVGTYDALTRQRIDMLVAGLVSKGMNAIAAKQQALMILDRQISAQASVIAFSKIYLLNGILLMCALPLLLFWKTGKGRPGGGTIDH